MGRALLAKPAAPVPNESPEQGALRATIIQIIQSELCGAVSSELWMQPIRRAADRIMRAIAHETMRP